MAVEFVVRCGQCVQADALSSNAAATRTQRNMAAIRDADRMAISAQKEANGLMREAEAAWAQAVAYDGQVSLLEESASTGEVKARRLSTVGNRAAELQQVADALARQAESSAAAQEQLKSLEAQVVAKREVCSTPLDCR